jgi:hypothetical protein
MRPALKGRGGAGIREETAADTKAFLARFAASRLEAEDAREALHTVAIKDMRVRPTFLCMPIFSAAAW